MQLKFVLAQINVTVGDLTGNADRILAALAEARKKHRARVVVFPELALTGYPPEDLVLRADFLLQVETELERIQRAVKDEYVVLGYPRPSIYGLMNAAGVICNGTLLAEYHKSILPNYSVFDEKRYFEPGHNPCVLEIDGQLVGITLCEDIWFEPPAAMAAAAGARVLLNLNASPFHAGKSPEREQLVSQRARANRLHIAYVNLVGGQDELVFDGGSFVVDDQGALTHRGEFFEEQLLPFVVQDGRTLPGRVLGSPTELRAVYQALVLGVRDYVRKNGFRGAVLGLSGGIDSALTLAIAVDALGADQVEAVLMPSRYTADMSNEDALREAQTLGVRHTRIPIGPAFDRFVELLAPRFGEGPAASAGDVTEQNIQARCRGILLMALSNREGRILLTTGNKSEMAVGYATLYGDMAGGFAPLRDVPKMLVYRLAEYVNREREIIPARVIERPPSAELAPDQKDSDSLPPYPLLDEILQRYVEQDQSQAEIIAAGFDAAEVQRVLRLVDRSEYKRRQAPPGVRISRRAFGRDRRYPLTNGFSGQAAGKSSARGK